MNNSDINHELLLNFIDESLDSLSEIENNVISLEKNPGNKDIINSIFRPFHSLKGNASYFSLMKITKLSHKVEDLLDALRKEELILNQSIIDVILPATDYLREMLNNVHNDSPQVSNKKKFESLIKNIEIILTAECSKISDCKDKIKDNILQLSNHLDPEGLKILDTLKELLQSIMLEESLSSAKTNASPNNILTFFETEAPTLDKKSSELSDKIKIHINNLKDQYYDEINKDTIDQIEDIFNTFNNSDTGIDQMVISMLKDEAKKLNINGTTISKTDTKTLNEPDSINKVNTKRTMRIPLESLDNFLKNVGELLSVEEMLKHFSKQLSKENRVLYQNIKGITSMFENVSKNLRDGIMEVRKVEASNLLNKAPRIVRDIAANSGKKISVLCMGGEIKIDKSYIDLLDAPLTHIVRNAADHGIESIENRLKNGKDENGLILISVNEENNNVILTISDDGAGLNYNKLQEKAKELGIIEEYHNLTEDEITELLFSSGVSTAETITDISGRGVGMNVVKHSIEEAGGKISISSNENKGTTFTITLPQNASTQIIDGYIIKSFSDEEFVLPLSIVSEAFSINQNDITTVTGKGRIVTRRGTAFPLFNIDNSLGILSNSIEAENRMVVICDLKSKSMALEIKEAVGIQKIVKKDVESGLLDQSRFEGAAVNGKGHIMLIISKDALMKFY